MKKRHPIFHTPMLSLALLALLGSCSRDDKGIDCITRYSGLVHSLSITPGLLNTIDGFCAKSNLDPSAYEFTSSYEYTVDVHSYKGTDLVVSAGIYLNGLPVFQNLILFNFDSTGILLDPPSGGWTGALPGKDTTGHQTLQSLRSIFLNNFRKCTIQGGVANAPITHPTAPYQDSCLTAMLGYFDAYNIDRNIPGGTQLVKAWLVCAADKMPCNFDLLPYPSIIVIDSTGEAIPLSLNYP